jgi:WD40 repeat protein
LLKGWGISILVDGFVCGVLMEEKQYSMKKFYAAILFSLTLFSGLSIHAQGEANTWYFGYGCGVDFNGGVPVADTAGDMYAWEGCSVICDAAGNILFYSDGDTVWNRNHVPMPNGTGLYGDESSTQSALIIKKPLSANIYYIFTVPSQTGGISLCSCMAFSEIDMSLDNGLGDITAMKNIPLMDTATEHLTAVRHADGSSVWVMAHEWNSNSFKAFLVTSNGVNTTPVTSAIGLAITTSFYNQTAVGAAKFSPDGDMLATTHFFHDTIQLFHFDNSTGLLSNVRYLSFYFCYGLEFSPSGDYLYVGKGGGSQGAVMQQFHVSLGNQNQIQWSAFNLNLVTSSNFYGMFQLGPDGKIYVDRWGYTHLGVIMQPDLPGSQCNYIDSAVYLNGRRTRGGLPGFNCSYFAGGESNPESVNDVASVNAQVLFPNPVSDNLHLESPDQNDPFVSIVIYELTGKQVYAQTLNSASEIIGELEIEPGVYFYCLTSRNGAVYSGKLVKE